MAPVVWYGMLDVKALIRFFDSGFVYRFFSLLLLAVLMIAADVFLILVVAGIIGRYLTLALVLGLSLSGFFLGMRVMTGIIARAKARVKEGIYPSDDFANLLGAFIATVLLILPGILSELCGLVFLIPNGRRAIGRRLTRDQGSKMKELYEYLKLYDF